MHRYWVSFFIGLVGTGFGLAIAPSDTKTVTKTTTTNAPAVAPPTGGACRARGLLPDPACTPGATNPDVTQATINSTICVRGWTATVRPPQAITGPIKTQTEIAYGITPPHPHPFAGAQGEELDHLIPLELGGSPASVQNLWPEAAPGYHQKDQTENRLKAEVCAGTIPLATAQHAIATDWETAP